MDATSRAAAEHQSIADIQRGLRENLPSLKARYSLQHVWLFGSRVRGEEGDDSDLDVLVEFSEVPSFFEFVRLENDLSRLLGLRVDLVMKSALKPRIGEVILREAVPV